MPRRANQGYKNILTRLLYDTESDGFVANATKIHCIVIIDVDTGEERGYRPHEISEAIKRLEEADERIGHNIQRHDEPLMKKLYGFKPKPGSKLTDTMIVSRTIFPALKRSDEALVAAGKLEPSLKGKHSIKAWGYRLGDPKGDYAEVKEKEARALGMEDSKDIADYVWGSFNEDMFAYMMQDGRTNLSLLRHLKPEKYPQAPLVLEHRVARVCDAMNIAGVPFDLQAAGELQATLVARKHEIETRLKERYGFWYAPASPDPTKALFIPKKPNAAQGYWGDEWTEEVDDQKKPGKKKLKKCFKGYPCTKIKVVEFNPGSGDHLAKVLQAEGWKPTKFTDGGKPAMDEEVIESIALQFPSMDGLAELLMINKRLSQLVGGKSSKYPLIDCVDENGLIHGVINPMGTITSRGAHMFPNLGQVPSAKKPFGKEFRALFTKHKPTLYRGTALPHLVGKVVPWKFLGADQEGLELRGLAHYLFPLDNGKYMKVVIEGDPHWMHVNAMGLAEGPRDKPKDHAPPTDRQQLHTIVREDGAKRFIYAYIYGAGDVKVGEIIYEALLNARRNGGPEGVELYVRFMGEGVVSEAKLRKIGKSIRSAFRKRIDGYGTLQDRISEQVGKRGRIIGLDGRIIPIRSDHSALNFLIQSAGAIVCKRWLADAFEECERRFTYNWDDPWSGDFVCVLWVHDEVQFIVREGLEKEIGDIIVRCAREAGEPYGFRVPLDSKWVQGDNWRDTH